MPECSPPTERERSKIGWPVLKRRPAIKSRFLTLPTLEGDSLEDFSIRVAESWKIGKKGFDNGAILLIVRDDRRLRIEVGYGLEGVLPDAIANRIINQVITPRFRSGDFAGGIEAGVDTMFKVTKGEVLPERSRAGGRNAAQGSSLMTVFMITIILALFIGMTSRRLLGGAFGGAASGLVASLFGAGGIGLALLLAVIVGAVVGAVGSTVGTGSAGNQWTGGSRRGGRGGGIFPGGFGGGGRIWWRRRWRLQWRRRWLWRRRSFGKLVTK